MTHRIVLASTTEWLVLTSFMHHLNYYYIVLGVLVKAQHRLRGSWIQSEIRKRIDSLCWAGEVEILSIF